MMFDIDESVAKLFYYDQYKPQELHESKEEAVARISLEQTNASGITELCRGAVMDSRAFEPCGYSMNAVLFRSYSTIHITPESGSSYASFETNQKVSSYKSLIANVIRTFRPRRFVMTLMADEGGIHKIKENPLLGDGRVCAGGLEYKRSSQASIKVEDDCNCLMGNWVVTNRRVSKTRERGLSVS